MRYWFELIVDVPTWACDAVVDWLIGRGASGVQEEYPGLWSDGPVVSGNPEEWGGEARENQSGHVSLKAYFHEDARIEDDLRAFLASLGVVKRQLVWTQRREEDYLKIWKESWRPTEVGKRVLVCPSWVKPQLATNRVVVRIDPGMAFGTGTHFTTAACIELLEEVLASRRRGELTKVLDVGAGTGILAIAALRLGAASALCLDVDKDAVEACRRNAMLNGVEDRLKTRLGSVSPSDGVFHIVLGNLLAHTIISIARVLTGAVARDGVLITSGVTVDQAKNVESALERHGMRKCTELTAEGWVATSWQHA